MRGWSDRCAILEALSVLAFPGAAAALPRFRMPVDGQPIICAYFDHGGHDWHCGSVRYSGHTGTDFAVSKGTPIVAAADGVVVETEDGYDDDCTSGDCAGGPTGLGNHVLLEHPDGTRTYYGHMKTWSVAVEVGQEVHCGDQLGRVGSSGLSTGNHVHFQVGTWQHEQDPYRGDCNDRAASLWVDQGNYGHVANGCANGLPASTCAPDAACGGALDTRLCDGDDLVSCAGGRADVVDCASQGLTCGDDGTGPACVSSACVSAPNGASCEGTVLRTCREGHLDVEKDCAAEAAICDATAAACLPNADDPTRDDGDPDAVSPPPTRPTGVDPGWSQSDPSGGLTAGCATTGIPSTPPYLLVVALASFLLGRRPSRRRRP